MTNLTGKVAVVTGAARGIGAAIARALAAGGATVVANYAGRKEAAKQIAESIVAEGGRAIAVQGDVSKPDDVRTLFAETREAFGAIDHPINNAGVGEFSPLEAVTVDHFRKLFDTNVLGAILTTKEAPPLFRPSGGSVINIGSLSTTSPTPGSAVYAATKGAIDALSSVLAVELSDRRIRVNTLAPGPVETDGTRAVGLVGSELQKQLAARTPLGRLGLPEDIAKVAVFLASDQAGWLTGVRIPAAGGLH